MSEKKFKRDPVIAMIQDVKLKVQKYLIKYPATYHCLDFIEAVAGYEVAHQIMYKKVKTEKEKEELNKEFIRNCKLAQKQLHFLQD